MTYESKYYIPKCNQFYSIRLKFADYKDLRILKNFTYWLVKDFVGVTMTMNLAHLEDVIERCSFLKNGEGGARFFRTSLWSWGITQKYTQANTLTYLSSGTRAALLLTFDNDHGSSNESEATALR